MNRKMISKHSIAYDRTCMVIGSIVLISFILSCAHKGDWAKRIDWKEIQWENIPTQEDYPDAGAIILLDEGKMEIIGDEKIPLSIFNKHCIVKILNPGGQKYASIAIPYGSESRVEKIKARTISPDGEITVLDDKNIFDITFYPHFVFYSDQRAKLFPLPAVEDGSLVEYRYEMKVQNRTFWHSWFFQTDVPTLLSRFTLVEATEWDVNYRMYGMELEPWIEENPTGFKSTYTWEARDIPAQKFEFGMPPGRESLAWLALAPVGIETWDDVSKLYYDISEPQIKPGASVKELAANLTRDVDNDLDKLQHIYEWVRDHIRYIAVAIGIGGFQPHPVEEILNNRYGDCKDMTTLLCSLAHEAGIDAFPVLVSTWQNGVPDTTLPSPLQFNHMIAYCPSVDGREIWMDATEKGCPFDQLPWYDQGLPMLIVGKEGEAKLVDTPRVAPVSNRTTLDWHVKLTSSGAATVHGKAILRGAYAAELREELIYASRDNQRYWLETYLAIRCSGAELNSFHISGLHPVHDPLIIEFDFFTTTFAVPHSQDMTFKPGSISAFELPHYFRSEERTHLIRFLYGLKNELNLTVNLPNGWIPAQPTLLDSLTSPFGMASWSWSWSSDSSLFSVNTTLRLSGQDIVPEEYKAFREFLDDIRERDLREVVLKKNDK